MAESDQAREGKKEGRAVEALDCNAGDKCTNAGAVTSQQQPCGGRVSALVMAERPEEVTSFVQSKFPGALKLQC